MMPVRAARFSNRYHLRAKERHPLGDVAPRDGLWLWSYVLATLACVAGGRGMGAAAPSALGSPWRSRPDRVGARLFGLGFHPGQKGGQKPERIRRIKEKRARSAMLFRTEEASRSV